MPTDERPPTSADEPRQLFLRPLGRPPLGLVLLASALALAVILHWLHAAFEGVPIRWSGESFGPECQFLSARTKDALADAGRPPLVALSALLIGAAAATAAVLRPRIAPRDRTVATGVLIVSAALGAGTSWAAYAGNALLLALGLGAISLVVVLVDAALLLTVGSTRSERRALRIAWVLSVALLLPIPWLVATTSVTHESFVCMS